MNIHPIFVHFPIALLTIYAVLEWLRFKKLLNWSPFFYIKLVFVVLGSIASYAALITGGIAEEAFAGTPIAKIVEIHSNWAAYTIGIFSVLAVAYLVRWIEKDYPAAVLKINSNKVSGVIWKVLSYLSELVQKPFVLVILSIIGLISVTITGALGGSIVYGNDVDPVVRFIYKFLVK